VTHTSAALKSGFSIVWRPPTSSTASVKFVVSTAPFYVWLLTTFNRCCWLHRVEAAHASIMDRKQTCRLLLVRFNAARCAQRNTHLSTSQHWFVSQFSRAILTIYNCRRQRRRQHRLCRRLCHQRQRRKQERRLHLQLPYVAETSPNRSTVEIQYCSIRRRRS
jgi:hypothetical protein